MFEFEGSKLFGKKCKICKHDLLYHVGHGMCEKSKHTTKRCKCKMYKGRK